MDEYIKIMKEDYSLLGNVILQSRGNMALDKFAMKCGYSPRVFQGYIRNEKTRKHNDWRGVAPSLYSLSNKMDNSLLAVRDINHKYIVVEGILIWQNLGIIY